MMWPTHNNDIVLPVIFFLHYGLRPFSFSLFLF